MLAHHKRKARDTDEAENYKTHCRKSQIDRVANRTSVFPYEGTFQRFIRSWCRLPAPKVEMHRELRCLMKEKVENVPRID
jgi:hypothetical protein